MYHEIIYQVPLENGEVRDIIEFYNIVFVTKLKTFLFELSTKSPDAFFNDIKNSPNMNQSSPNNQMTSGSPNNHTNNNNNNNDQSAQTRSIKSGKGQTKFNTK